MAFSSPTQDFVVTSGLNVQGIFAVSSSTGNTSTLQVDGGAAIAKNLIVGTTSQLYGDVIVFGNLEVKGVVPYITVTGTSNLSIVNAGITTATQLDVVTRLVVGGLSQLNNATLANGTNSISSTSGALVVSGGVGIGRDLFVGGNLVMTNGVITTPQTTFNLLNTSATTVNFAGEGTAITIGANSGYTAIRNLTTITNTTNATSTNSGALQVVGGVGIGGSLYVGSGISGNLIGGSTGALVYQSGISTTAFLNIGSSGQLLTVVGGVPSWTSLEAVAAGQSNTATNLALGTAGQIPIQSSPGVTAFINTGSVGQILQMQTGNTATFVSTSTLQSGYSVTATNAINIADGTAGQVPYQTAPGATSFYGPGTAGNVLVSNGTSAPTYNNTLTLTGTTNATSTSTGALQVRGGVGIGGSLYATEIYDSGNRVLTTATSIVSSIIAGTDISINTSTGNVTISDIATLQSVTNRGSTTTNIVYITNATPSTNPATGALIISGGVGISGAVNVDSTLAVVTQLSVKSNSLDPANSSTIILSSAVPIGYSAFTIQNTGASGQSYTFDVGGNNRELTGGTSINEGNFTLKDDTNNAYRMVITKTGNILVNTTTDTGAQLQVNGSISIKSSLLETTVTLINNTATTVVDSFVSSVYRSCKSLVQIQDGPNFEITEIVLLHDGAGQVYKSEYGIISTTGELGIFSSDLQGDGIVRLYFTANSSSSKKISIIKTALAI